MLAFNGKKDVLFLSYLLRFCYSCPESKAIFRFVLAVSYAVFYSVDIAECETTLGNKGERNVMSTRAVEIRILGKVMRVNCPAGQEKELHLAAKDFDRRLRELSERTNVANLEQLLTIAALNLSHEYHAEKKQQHEDKLELEWRLSQLEKYVESALVEISQAKDKRQVAATP